MSYFSRVAFSDSPNIDAFGRLRVAQLDTMFSVQSQYGPVTTQMESGNTGTGVAPAYDSNVRWSKLSATAGSGTSFMQSYQYIPYQPGKSTEISITGRFDTAVAGAVVDFGFFDANNGVIYRQNGTNGLQFIVRSSTSGAAVNDAVNQASWNIDKFDGTGPSGITLDATKVFILIIDLQFLGMGRVRCGFDIDGVVYYAHEFLHANLITVPYMQAATLPVQALITATATAGTSNAYFKCAMAAAEGGFEAGLGYTFSTGEGTVTAASGARTHLLSIRPKTTYNGLPNRELFILDSVNLLNVTVPIFWEVCVGAAFSVAPTYADVNTSYSAYEYGTGGTYSNLTNGIVLLSGYSEAAKDVFNTVSALTTLHHPITLNRAGAAIAIGTLSLLVSGIGGTSATRATFNFTEIR